MTDLTLGNLSDLAELVGAGTILTGAIVGWFQLKMYRKEQINKVTNNLMNTFYSPALAHSVALIRKLPDAVSAEELRDQGHEYEEAAIVITTTFETMGFMVYRQMAPLELVIDLAGGMISVMSRKLSIWQETIREEHRQPSWAEWFEWLGDQAQQIKEQQQPAHVREVGNKLGVNVTSMVT